RDDRRFAGPSNAQVADADDRTLETVAARTVACEPLAAPARRRAVHAAQGLNQLTRRKGRTLPTLFAEPPAPGVEAPNAEGGRRSSMTRSVFSLAPRFASTSARAAAPRLARRTGSVTRVNSISSSSRPDCTCAAAPLARNASAISQKFCM